MTRIIDPYVLPLIIPLAALFIATLASWSHVLWYGLRYRWWRTHAGRSVFCLALSVSLALGLSVANIFAPSYTGELIIDTAVYLGIGAAAVYLIYASTRPPSRKRELKEKVEEDARPRRFKK